MSLTTQLRCVLAGCVWLLASVATLPSRGHEIETLGIVRELDDVEVPAKREGLIEELLVRRGVQVRKDQLLSALETRDMQLNLQVIHAEIKQAEIKAQDDGPILASEAGVERANQEMRLMAELGDDAVYLEQFRAENNLKKATAELKSAMNQREQSRLMVAVKKHESSVLENDIAQTEVRSPVEGIVRELKKNQGEWVQRGEPILVVTRMDRLLVEGFLDSDEIAPSEVVGSPVSVLFRVKGTETFIIEGLVVSHAAPKLELDGKFAVWVEFNNQLVNNASSSDVWLIRPGMRAKMRIDVREPPELARR